MKYLIVTLISSSLVWQVSARSIADNIIPPSPTASTFMTYGNLTVNEFTGTPNVDVPLYTMEEGDLSVPIGLSYDASGRKVEEIAGLVGLGWKLNAGGAITRIIRGLPDEIPGNGYFDAGDRIDNYLSDSTQQMYNYLDGINSGSIDAEPDHYFFSFPGGSGKFVMDRDKNIFATPYQNLYITGDPSTHFTITTENGVSYTFAEYEEILNKNSAACGFSQSTSGFARRMTWYLSSIESPNCSVINFNYIPISYDYQWVLSEWYEGGNSGISSLKYSSCNGEVTSSGKLLQTIEAGSKNRKVEFVYSSATARNDVTNLPYLDSIKVSGLDSTSFFKRYSLNYFETQSNKGAAHYINRMSGGGYSVGNGHQYRLFLKDVYQIGTDNNELLVSSFDYDRTPLPSRFSTGKDMWGFYNGKDNNPNYVPITSFDMPVVQFDSIYPNPYSTFSIEGGDRYPDTTGEKTKAGSLTRINYPTGGYTEFNYEPNKFDAGKDYSFKFPDFIYSVQGPQSSEQVRVLVGSTGTINQTSGNITINSRGIVKLEMILASDGFCERVATLKKSSGEVIVQKKTVITGNINSAVAILHVDDILLEAGDYILELDICNSESPGIYATNYSEIGLVRVTYFNTESGATNIVDPSTSGFTAGGLRVKEVKDCTGAGECLTTRYSYVEEDGVTSSGELVTRPKFIDFDLFLVCYGVSVMDAFSEKKSWDEIFSSIGTTCPEGFDIFPNKFTISSGDNIFQWMNSTLGYLRVEKEVVNGASTNGKTVREFTSYQDFVSEIIEDNLLAGQQQPISDILYHWEGIERLALYYYKNGDGSGQPGNNLPLNIYFKQAVDAFFNPSPLFIVTDTYVGREKVQKIYANNGTEVKRVETEYEYFHNINSTTGQQYAPNNTKSNLTQSVDIRGMKVEKHSGLIENGDPLGWRIVTYPTLVGNMTTKKVTNTETRDGQLFTTVVNYSYDSIDYHLKLVTRTTSDGKMVSTHNKYVSDYAKNPFDPLLEYVDKMQERHMDGIVIESNSTITKDGVEYLIGGQIQQYDTLDYGNVMLRKTHVLELKEPILKPADTLDSNSKFIELISRTEYADKLTISKYNNCGRPLEIIRTDDIPMSIIWGYNNLYPIARVENATYAQIENALGGANFTLENDGVNLSAAQLTSLRSITGAMVTAFSYKDGVGQETVIDPNNKEIKYTYDEFGRLRQVTDDEGNILQNFDYHYASEVTSQF